MLRTQKIVPRVPPRLLGPLIRLLGVRRFVGWSFGHYLNIAPPEFADGGDYLAFSQSVPTPASTSSAGSRS